MNIIPISSLIDTGLTPRVQSPITVGGKVAGTVGGIPATGGNLSAFKSIFEDALASVDALNQAKDQDSYALSVGEIDDIGAMMVNSQKADVAFQMVVQMRNKVLDAYSEIMRMNV